jgi:rubrerythrin
MSKHFTGKELLEMAMGIEENGRAFYQAMADKTKNDSIRAMYNHLVIEEKRHQATFQNMLKSLGHYEPAETYKGEYVNYLKALTDNTVFSSIEQAQHKAASVNSEVEAIDLGIQAEKDSILFYDGMRHFVQPTDNTVIQNIIDEEKLHLNQLSELREIAASERD